MAQLRQDYETLSQNDIEVVVVGPEKAKSFANYFEENELSFYGCPDPDHSVLKLYGQEVKIFKLGRMPAQVLVDKDGIVRFVHYGNSMSDIPATSEILADVDVVDNVFES
jgi:peroxiredoxin Q/BCP